MAKKKQSERKMKTMILLGTKDTWFGRKKVHAVETKNGGQNYIRSFKKIGKKSWM